MKKGIWQDAIINRNLYIFVLLKRYDLLIKNNY